MNRRAGVQVELGVTRAAVAIGSGGAPHTFEVSSAGGARAGQRALAVDAAGRADLLARALGLRVREDEHRIGSVWGRFESVADVDDLGPEAWRARVRHSTRVPLDDPLLLSRATGSGSSRCTTASRASE